jgi:hypothetical protein
MSTQQKVIVRTRKNREKDPRPWSKGGPQKYHDPKCGELKSAESRTKKDIVETEFPSAADAQEKGYKACKKCCK